MKRTRRFWAELRRRKVVGVTLTYIAGAAAVIQTVSTIKDDLNLPAWSTRATIVLSLIGLPIAILLAWLFEVRAEAPADPAPPATPPEPPVLPTRVYRPTLPGAPLIGRESELRQASTLLSDPVARLLTFTGPGGMGKTRLAQEVAVRASSTLAHGACLVPLAGVEAAESLPSALADALELKLSPRESAARQLIGFLQEKQLLLVLDNFEHLLEGAGFVSELLARAAGLRIIVTSRQRLNVAAETVLPLDSLALPTDGMALTDSPAASLFLQVARRIDRNLKVDDAVAAAITRICRVADGIPLAIELAASSVGVLSCAEIAWELEQRNEVLLGTRRDLPPRHQSLHAAFESSWRLLQEDERRTFRRLSVFRNGFDRDAAATVASAQLPVLARLVDASLLRRGPNFRFEILEVLRQIAEEKLAEDAAEAVAVRQRHSDYILTALAEIAAADPGPQRETAIDRCAEWISDIRAAWLWAVRKTELAQLHKATRALYLLLDARGRSSEGAELFRRAAEAVRPLPSAKPSSPHAEQTFARLLTAEAAFDLDLGRVSEAAELLREALPVLRTAGNRVELAFALGKQASVARASGDFRSPAFEETLALCREIGDAHAIALALNGLGAARQSVGEYEEAKRLYQESSTLLRGLGLESEAWLALNNLAGIAQVQGDFDGAARILNEALAAARSRNNPRALSFLLVNLGYVSYRNGDYEAAAAVLAESITLAREMGYRSRLGYSLNTLANIYAQRGDFTLANQTFREALSVAVDAEETPLIPSIVLGIARLHIRRGEHLRATPLVQAVARHPLCDEETRSEAQALLQQVPDTVGVEADAWSLDQAVQEVLETPVPTSA